MSGVFDLKFDEGVKAKVKKKLIDGAGKLIEYEKLEWTLLRHMSVAQGVNDYVFRADVDEHCYLYKHVHEYTVSNAWDTQLESEETYGFVSKTGIDTSKQTKTDTSGPMEEKTSSSQIPKVRRRNKRSSSF